jgi:tetratricopeptide (TPR) repeat protein
MCRLRRCRSALAVAVLLGALAPAALAEKIAEVKIEGLKRVNPDMVLNLMASRKGGDYDPAVVEEDFNRIMDLGFFDVMTSGGSPSRGPDGVVLTLKLVENPVITGRDVRGVRVPAVDAAKIRQLAEEQYKDGEVFNLRRALPLAMAISRLYEDAGYEADVPPPLVNEAGVVIVVVYEVTVDTVDVLVDRPDSFLDLDAFRNWLGIKEGSVLSLTQLRERTSASLDLGLFIRLKVDELQSETNEHARRIRIAADLDDRPVPTAEACQFVAPKKVLADLPVYRKGDLPSGRILSPTPTAATLEALRSASAGAPDDAVAAARYALALWRAGKANQAVRTAAAALPALEAATKEPDAAVLYARCALLNGDAARAFAVLDPLRASGKLPAEGYPTLVHAAVCLVADPTVTDPKAARLPGDTLAWAAKVLLMAANREKLPVTPEGGAYYAALASAWDVFAKMNDAALAAHHEAYERLIGMLSVLSTLGAPLSPVGVIPACAEVLDSPIQPVLNDPRLLGALTKRKGDDPDARFAWAHLVVLREAAAGFQGGGVELKVPESARKDELLQAQVALGELMAVNPTAYGTGELVRALSFLIQGNAAQAQEILKGLLDSPDGAGAEQLFLFTASLAPPGESPDKAKEAILALADSLSPVIADGKPHPRAQFARYSLLGAIERYDQAIQEATAVATGPTNDPAAWASVGFFEARRGKSAEADAALAKATEIDPGDADAAYVLGLARWIASGDPVPSLPLMQRLRDQSPVDIAAAEIGF